jgi:hypothetical protein
LKQNKIHDGKISWFGQCILFWNLKKKLAGSSHSIKLADAFLSAFTNFALKIIHKRNVFFNFSLCVSNLNSLNFYILAFLWKASQNFPFRQKKWNKQGIFNSAEVVSFRSFPCFIVLGFRRSRLSSFPPFVAQKN